ncbi:Hypothetical predicted protein [Octopus vulgaris]|uniref:Uncharacterized protein n=1 Tax=Octopus vulgaris TaxID=6645 RepID=A0AA36B8H1_OCTVU|nr:Hypothetical predicted protein [Octopus vulgaris]
MAKLKLSYKKESKRVNLVILFVYYVAYEWRLGEDIIDLKLEFVPGCSISVINIITDDEFESILGHCLESDPVLLAMSTEFHTTNEAL